MSTEMSVTDNGTRQLRHYPATGTRGAFRCPNRPPSTAERLIIDMFPYSCCYCEVPDVFVEDQIVRVPDQLQERRIDQISWERAINRIRSAVQDHSSSVMTIITSFITLIPLFWTIPKIRNMHKAIKDALDEVNREIFEPRGIYVKTQKSVLTRGNDKYETAWLSVALTPEECNILKEEPHVYVFSRFKNMHIPNSEACCPECEECCGVPVVI
eukprot:TRINITY_DN7202_c0_g1_i1.p1 TRINITY_DN7202_c0_g1~~TRINITY_DN7202_c0_g1_i1.p1  ORF type:complete len:213 (-),score=37.14 TRINITY_DN7202_c0_g1_i1:281-919(-)